MPKSSRLTAKPLSVWNLARLEPHPVQADEFDGTKEIFKKGVPPHQIMFYDGTKSICAAGFIDMGDGMFYQWSLFGKHIKRQHLFFLLRYMNNYLNMLDYKSVHHIIRKDLPWTGRFLALEGYKYARDENEFTEHWVRVNPCQHYSHSQ